MTRTLRTTPVTDGFRMPAEWTPHSGTWMLWPEWPDNWRLGGKPAQAAFAQVASAIANYEPVTMCVSPQQYLNARHALPLSVRVVEMTSNDSWIRDCGPTFVRNDEGLIRGVDWRFNAWGGIDDGLYVPWDQDDLVGEKVLEMERSLRYAPSIVLEGGSIEVDGEGTLLVTMQCLLNKNRNPDLSKDEIESALKFHLGVTQVIWLDQGVVIDKTEGHADNLARFVGPGRVVMTWIEDHLDPKYEICQDAYLRLSKAHDAKGRPLEVIKIIQPSPLFLTDEEAAGINVVDGTAQRLPGLRLAASYVDFYFCNGAMIVPALDPAQDDKAARTFKKLCPNHDIIMVPAREILLGGGNIHCITQQQTKGQFG